MNFTEIEELVYRFKHLGVEECENGTTLIGKAPFLGSQAWLNKTYSKLDASDMQQLEIELKTEVPNEYKFFLSHFSNGLNILSSNFSLYGLRKQLGRSIAASRQPYSLNTPNIGERPDNAPENYFFIGGYNWDGSHLYIDRKTNIVHYCKQWNATSLLSWSSLEEMLTSEISRIYLLFDKDGRQLKEDTPTIPL